MSKIPILVLAFNRADHVTEALKPIREYQPEKLYLACDGPRTHKEGEKEAVEATQNAMLDAVDWPCEVKTLFREENLGCANAVYEAITWFFRHEEWGIICEDDVVLSQDFFRFCEELLPRYKDDDRVMQITSQYYGPHREVADTYSFERRPFIWGWATWRRSWCKYMDMTMAAWPTFRIRKMLPTYGWLQTIMMWHYWKKTYNNLATNASWATRWHFAAVVNELCCIAPHTNLALNIGCDSGTHYESKDGNPYSHLKMGKLRFPLQHPTEVCLDKKQLAIGNAEFLRIRKLGIKNKLRKVVGR